MFLVLVIFLVILLLVAQDFGSYFNIGLLDGVPLVGNVGVFVCFQSNVPNKIDIPVRRNNILEDSYRVIMGFTRADLLKTR